MKFLVFLALVAVSTFLVSGQVTTEVPASSPADPTTISAAATESTVAATSTAAPTATTAAPSTTTAAATSTAAPTSACHHIRVLPHGFSYFTAKSYH
uniref:Mucin like 1 n=1 Tax=Bos indicus x Bos taurus TaxID=30522 RepID=A0A4W2D5J9_BOBOX